MTYRIGEHCAQVGNECQECQRLEYYHIDATEYRIVVVVGQQYQATHHKLRKQYEQPRHYHAHNAANILQADY